MNQLLATTELLDCQGRVTHRLTLEIDGKVTVHFESSGVSARIDPTNGAVLTAGIVVPDHAIAAASQLRPI